MNFAMGCVSPTNKNTMHKKKWKCLAREAVRGIGNMNTDRGELVRICKRKTDDDVLGDSKKRVISKDIKIKLDQ